MTGAVIPTLYGAAEFPAGPTLLQDTDSAAGPEPSSAEPGEETAWPSNPDQALLESEFPPESDDWGADRDLWMYRDRTVVLLRRYARLAVEIGRLPSLLGREFFRAKISSRQAATFEDTVIFVHDVEMSLEKLGGFEKKLIAMVVLEEFSQEEAARLLQCSARTVGRYIYEALDRLSEIFLRGSILEPVAGHFPNREAACQGGKSDQFSASDCSEGKNKFQTLSDLPH